MKKAFRYFFLLLLGVASQAVKAQNPVNWTEDQLMPPAQLAQRLQSGKNIPVLFSIGPSAVIPHSIDIGMVQEKENLQKLEKQLRSVPKGSTVVVYCGCCPYAHCPNVRPAMALLKKMKFTHYYLLDLPHNIKTDWMDKRYPTGKTGGK